MQIVTKVVGKLCDSIGMITNISLAANMLLIVYSVLGRVAFSKPVGGLVDYVSMIFALTCVCAFCYTEKEKGHVRMDLLIQTLPRIGKIIVHTITGIIAMAVIVFIVMSMYTFAGKTLAASNATMTVGIPYFPFVVVTVISMLLFLAAMAVNFVRAYEEWRAK